jgi:hypothetical protein
VTQSSTPRSRTDKYVAMPDSQPNLMPPTSGDFTPGTPSGLTPNTRSEAEAALWRNSLAQTDSAAPTTPLPSHDADMGLDAGAPRSSGADTLGQGVDEGASEAQQSYHRPRGSMRMSPENYSKALHEARKQSTADSELSTDTTESAGATYNTGVSTPTNAIPFPPPGHGVVPLHTGIGTGQAEAVKKARPTGMTLGDLGRQASWSEQDMKHIYSAPLMGQPAKDDAGYSGGGEGKGVGGS